MMITHHSRSMRRLGITSAFSWQDLKPLVLGFPVNAQWSPAVGQLNLCHHYLFEKKSQVFKPDFYGYFVIFLDSHWIPLASSTSTSRPGGVDGVLRQFYQDLDDLFHADSVGNGRGQGQGCDLIFLGPMGEGYRGWLSLDQGNVTWFRYGSVYVLVRKYIQMEIFRIQWAYRQLSQHYQDRSVAW